MKFQSLTFQELAKENLENTSQREILNVFSSALKMIRDVTFATLPDGDAAIEKGRKIRADLIENLPYYLELFEENATKAGAKVIWAKDAKDANDFIVSLAKKKNVDLCVKGKSMVSEEISLREELIKSNINAFETDLGEFIVQLADRPPFHIVGPALNLTAIEISDLFTEQIGYEKNENPTPPELGAAARVFLRDKFQNAQLGITGVNMAVAETGTIFIVENEGNIRYSSSAPKTHVALMGIEKVIPTLSDAAHMLKLLTRSCTGQKISNYASIVTGPRKGDEIDGPEELYIVILDNGRSKIYADKALRNSLQCIKCGLCAAACPVYTHVGGYAYGWVYSGPIGSALNPMLLGLNQAKDLYHACTLCGSCRDSCPAGVDVRSILLNLREKERDGDKVFNAKKTPISQRLTSGIFSWGISNKNIYNTSSGLMRAIARPFSKKGKIPKIAGNISGWTQSRDMPEIPKKSFHKLYKEQKEKD